MTRDLPLPIDPDASEPRERRWDVALAVAVGGAIGALARLGVNEAIPHDGNGFPWATFVENVSGCFVIGVLLVLLVDVWQPTRYGRPFLAVGILGGYTTFSTYAVDTRTLFANGDGLLALTYLFGTLAVGLVATFVGLAVTRKLAGVTR